MSQSLAMTEREQLTAIVFGDTFALYDEASFDEFLEPLYARLKANRISTDVFKGKRCLDAGCGGGRGSILMALAGARAVVGVDLSPRNIESCRKRAAQKGLTNVSFQQASLASIPLPNDSFDIVWCNGVLHHTEDPDMGLQEIARVLKPGGWLWLYLYGSGGTYWYAMDWIRAVLRDVDIRECIAQLRLMDSPVRRIAEWIDDWFVAYLRRYTVADVTRRLDELGFDHTEALRYGVGYDTSHRRQNASAEEIAHMGDGDVRHFARKAEAVKSHQHRLPDPPDGKGSPFADPATVTQFGAPLAEISASLDALERRLGHLSPAIRIMVSRTVHSKIRTLLETDRPFDASALHDHLRLVKSLVDDIHH